MMGDSVVVDIASRRSHKTGDARCLACRHEWTAVAPLDADWLDCPSCTLVRGRFVGPCEREGLQWACNCGNDLFHLTPDGIYCPHCAAWQWGWD